MNGWQDRLVRILSLNAWGGALYDALIEWLPSCGAETHFADSERALPQRANLFDDVVVVCGDLNLLPDSETFSVLKSAWSN